MRAVSIDAGGFARWRRRPLPATVHSVFERVINLQAGDGAIFAVAAAGVDDAPDTLVADGPLAAPGIAPGDAVEADGERIVAGSAIELVLAGARPWRAVLPAYPADDRRLRGNVAAVRQTLARTCSPGIPSSPLGGELARLLAYRCEQLVAALARGDLDTAARHGRAMLGLGPGLTPSGDDFLAGLLATLHLPGGPGQAVREFGALLVTHAGDRTNAISVAMLRAAAQGRVRECVIALLRELVAGDADGVAAALSRVLAIGSTSGGDMAAGIAAAFDLQARLARASRPERAVFLA